jgi:hypothetical protein
MPWNSGRRWGQHAHISAANNMVGLLRYKSETSRGISQHPPQNWQDKRKKKVNDRRFNNGSYDLNSSVQRRLNLSMFQRVAFP